MHSPNHKTLRNVRPDAFPSPEGEGKIRVNIRVTISSQPSHYLCVAAAGTTYSGNLLGGAPCTIV